jgi:hypothetical protein
MTAVLPADIHRLTPEARARLIYAGAKAELGSRLWQAALGDAQVETGAIPVGAPSLPLAALLDALVPTTLAASAPPAQVRAASDPLDLLPAAFDQPLPATASFSPAALGPNRVYATAIAKAATRTGLPAAALAATIDAEAAKSPGGAWNALSRNPRSSAAGLGQFLSGTWESEANRPGTWLNQTARANGWLDLRGHVSAGARSALLALRYEPDASIEAIADYARSNLDRLGHAGIHVADTVGGVANAAYLAHHLGPGDAIRFLRGGLDQGHAAHLLTAQVGASEAKRRIAAAGDPALAHRAWLLGYVEHHIRAERFG